MSLSLHVTDSKCLTCKRNYVYTSTVHRKGATHVNDHDA
jgi:hypothetical protein